jgi:hypothetical protein
MTGEVARPVSASSRGAPVAHTASFVRRAQVALVTWLAMLGLDFLLNGAVFAGIYQGGSPFLLAPMDAFRRIPIGYLAFLGLALGIVELTHRLGVSRAAAGLRLGLVLGAVAGVVSSLGLYSIATISPMVALVFALVWFGLIAVGSAVAARGLALRSLRGLVIRVAAFDAVCVATVVALESFGVVSTA